MESAWCDERTWQVREHAAWTVSDSRDRWGRGLDHCEVAKPYHQEVVGLCAPMEGTGLRQAARGAYLFACTAQDEETSSYVRLRRGIEGEVE